MHSISIELGAGEQANIAMPENQAAEILCLSGRARVIDQFGGVGWLMRAGEGCLLRVNSRYRVLASSRLHITVRPRNVSLRLTAAAANF